MAFAALAAVLNGSPAAAGDWPQWGGRAGRNMVSDETGLPETFGPVSRDGPGAAGPGERNVKWSAKVGLMACGSPVVAGGRVFISSNSRGASDRKGAKPALRGRPGGWFQCFDERTGRRLWQLLVPNLAEKDAPHSDTGYGICSTAAVEGERVYLVSNRGEVLCLDARGMANGNGGPFRDEAAYLGKAAADDDDGDVLWLYDMVTRLKVHPHDASSCSVLVHGDCLYVCTGNGVDRGEKKVWEPLSPSVVVFEKATGRRVAQDGEEIGTRLYKGQWSSPSLSRAGGREQIIYGGGDGLCYSFEPVRPSKPNGSGEGAEDDVAILKKNWAVDCVPPDYKVRDGKPVSYRQRRGDTPCEIVATPACVGDRVYVTIGRDPHHGKGGGSLICIDAVKGRRLWSCQTIGRSLSTVSVTGGLLYVAETFGAVHCLDADTGEHCWTHSTRGNAWASTLAADGKVYLPTTRGIVVLAAGRQEKLLATVSLGGASYSTPCAANGTLYFAGGGRLYAVAADGGK